MGDTQGTRGSYSVRPQVGDGCGADGKNGEGERVGGSDSTGDGVRSTIDHEEGVGGVTPPGVGTDPSIPSEGNNGAACALRSVAARSKKAER